MENGPQEKSYSGYLDLPVFVGSALMVVPFVVLGALAPQLLKEIAGRTLAYLTGNWSWLYLASASFFVVLALIMALSPWGSIRLGNDNESPEYSLLSWFAMLFSAGMGIGLVFWSIAEPLTHFASPPMGPEKTAESARLAFQIFFQHWGLHPWGIYVAVGLPMAYFQYRKGARATISGCLTQATHGRWKHLGQVVDMLSIWATVMGVVTSLGLGALQISRGFSLAWGLPGGLATTAMVIGCMGVLFITSALSGVKRGIRILSLVNVGLMLALLAYFLFAGPLSYIANTFFFGLFDYVKGILPLSTTLTLFDNPSWTRGWTVFYWAWWIAWAPFVGAFIASISKGRTIREFVFGVMLLPALFSTLFSSALGGTAIWLSLFKGMDILSSTSRGLEAALFKTLSFFPGHEVVALLASLLIASFFITSADSAIFVIGRFSTGGDMKGAQTPEGRILIVFWGILLGCLAMALIWSEGLKALQTASIIGAFPFVFVIFLLLFTLIRSLSKENSRRPDPIGDVNSRP